MSDKQLRWRGMRLPLLLLALAAACAAAAHSTTQPTPRAAHPLRGLRIAYSWGGGIRGDFHHRLIATPDVASGKADGDMTRVSGDRAVAVADLLRRADVMNWPAGIRGRGQWNDDYHYFLDLTMDGKTHSIHGSTPKRHGSPRKGQKGPGPMEGRRWAASRGAALYQFAHGVASQRVLRRDV